MAFTKEAIEAALERGHTIDITTTGRRSGKPRRLEIVFHNIGGRTYLRGTPYPTKPPSPLKPAADPPFIFPLEGRTTPRPPPPPPRIDHRAPRAEDPPPNA